MCKFKYVLSKNSKGLCSIYFEEGEKIDVYVDNENVKKFITNCKDRVDFFHILTNLKQNYEIENKFNAIEMNDDQTISFIRKHTRELADRYCLFENINYKFKRKRKK